jgi:hypothetical protein
MTEDVAKLIFLLVMVAGITVWAVSLSRALRLGQPPRRPDEFASEPNDSTGEPQSDWQTGTISLRGNREALAKALIRSLVQLQFGLFASIFKIQQYDDGRIVLKKVGPLVCNLPPALYFTEAEVSLRQTDAARVEAAYRIGYGRLVRRLRGVALCSSSASACRRY